SLDLLVVAAATEEPLGRRDGVARILGEALARRLTDDHFAATWERDHRRHRARAAGEGNDVDATVDRRRHRHVRGAEIDADDRRRRAMRARTAREARRWLVLVGRRLRHRGACFLEEDAVTNALRL